MEYKKLDSIFPIIRNGASIKQTPYKAGKPITRIETIVDNKIDLTRVGYADILNDNYEDFYLKDGDILMSHINSVNHLGKAAIVENIDIDIIHGMNLLILKSDKAKVFPKYSYYYFITNKFRKQLISITKKSVNQASFNISDLKELEIPIPSYEDQIRIANLLEKIETTITERKNAIDFLDELVKATFFEMFGDNNSENLKPLSQHLRIQQGFAFKSKKFSKTGIPIIKIGTVNKGFFDTKSFSYINESNDEKLEKFKVYKNDLLISMTGTVGKDDYGNTCLATDFSDYYYLNQRVAKLIPDEIGLNKLFLMYFLRSPSIKSEIIKSNRGVRQANISNEDILSIQINLPPIALQNQFADIAKKIENIKTEQEAQLKNLEELYASLSHQVFEGTINLSKVPFDVSLLPNPIKATPEAPIEQSENVVQKELPKETTINEIQSTTKSKLIWGNVSYKEVADYIRYEFVGHYFNTEMLLRYLREDLGMQVNYFSSAEQKKNPQYENADDFYRFIATAVTGENHFLTLEQVFYNAETENIPNISFAETDLENLSKKDKKERSGIYFHIKDETTTP